MKQIDKNTVAAENQVKKNARVKYINPVGKGLKVAFLGNSITLHGVKDEIGWFKECGMAASSEDKDYVHIVVSEVKRNHADASFLICNVSDWEREYKKGKTVYHLYSAVRDFNPDIIVARMIENCPRQNFDKTLFKKEYADFISYIGNGKSKVIVTLLFPSTRKRTMPTIASSPTTLHIIAILLFIF